MYVKDAADENDLNLMRSSGVGLAAALGWADYMQYDVMPLCFGSLIHVVRSAETISDMADLNSKTTLFP